MPRISKKSPLVSLRQPLSPISAAPANSKKTTSPPKERTAKTAADKAPAPKKIKAIPATPNALNSRIEILEDIVLSDPLFDSVSNVQNNAAQKEEIELIKNRAEKLERNLAEATDKLVHLQKVIKNAEVLRDKKINQLFVKICLLLLFLILSSVFVFLWIQTN